ncbi:hypothetical protein JOC36_000744 [Weissella uvarum]|nr:hypothetical protein [Weissella uvarum]
MAKQDKKQGGSGRFVALVGLGMALYNVYKALKSYQKSK